MGTRDQAKDSKEPKKNVAKESQSKKLEKFPSKIYKKGDMAKKEPEASTANKKKRKDDDKTAAGDAPAKKKSRMDSAAKGKDEKGHKDEKIHKDDKGRKDEKGGKDDKGNKNKKGKEAIENKSRADVGKGGKEEKGGKDDKAKGDKKADEKSIKSKKSMHTYVEVEPEEIPKTASIIAREEAEYRAMLRRQKFKRRWPEVTKVKFSTKPWKPPGPPEKVPRVIIDLPKLKTKQWIPPFRRRMKSRPRLPRMTPDKVPPLYECHLLKKIWHNFEQVQPNKMILQGTVGCDSKKYSSTHCGAQTACIALVARGLLEEKPPSAFVKSDVDDVIDNGDLFYHQCMIALKCYKGKPALQLHQLLNSFYLHDTKYTVKLQEVDHGVLAKHPDMIESRNDLAQLMEKRIGTEYMLILTLGRDKHFFIWGHPPDPQSGSQVKTICYMFDPHMLNDIGQPDDIQGGACCNSTKLGGAFLRYAGVASFVNDFLSNYGQLTMETKEFPQPDVTLTAIEVVQKEPLIREPRYELDLKALKVHCDDEWRNIHKNTLYDEKIYEGKYPQESLSAVSLATSRSRSKKKMAEFFQKLPKEPLPSLPVAPERAPPEPTKEQILQLRGEDFFLYCPKTDVHTYGRDDLIPFPFEEKLLFSPVDLADKNFNSQYKQLNAQTWILRGTRHFAVVRYEKFKSYTGVACCVAALGMLRRLRGRGWNEDTVNETLDIGYNLFRESLGERGGLVRRLVLGELKDTFKIRDRDYKFKHRGIAVWGKLYSSDPKVYDLCRGLETFFKEADAGVLQIPGDLETAIWNEGGKYFLYHPWPADARGRRVSLQGGGKACVMFFTKIQRLCDHFLESTEDLKRKAFSIADVLVFDVGQRAEPFNQMKPVGSSRWIVRGHFHEGDERFPEEHRNKQATPTSIAAIAMAHIIDPAEWKPEDVDEVLTQGDVLYEKTMKHLEDMGINLETPVLEEEVEGEEGNNTQGPSATLAAADVLPRFRITDDDHVEAHIGDSPLNGTLNPKGDQELMTLKKGLNKLFSKYNSGVLTARGSSIGVWRHDNHLYMFDPHGCDEEGQPSDDPRAAATLIRMKNNVKELADVIMNNLPPGSDDSYNLSPVEITMSKIHPETGAPEHKLANRAFDWMKRGCAAILLGPRGQNSAIGKAADKVRPHPEDTVGRKLGSLAASAFLMATQSVPPPYMHQDHMFNFLDVGAEYYKKHEKEINDNYDTLYIRLTDEMEFGANTMTIDMDENTVNLPLRLPDIVAEGGGDEEEEAGGIGEGEEEEKGEVFKEMKDVLMAAWNNTSKPNYTYLLAGPFHILGVWMEPQGKVVVFDAGPTLHRGRLVDQRITWGEEWIKAHAPVAGEGGEDEEDEEAGGEGEEKPEVPPEPISPDSCAALMVFATPAEFIDRLVANSGLNDKQAKTVYEMTAVTLTNELTPKLREKKAATAKAEDEEGDDAGAEDALIEPLDDAAIGKYFERMSRSKASVRGRLAQNENYFIDQPNRDNQDAATAVMGIVVEHIEPYIYWKPSLIDSIVKYGDRLYTISLPNAQSPPHLTPAELVKEFHVVNFNVKLEIEDSVVEGDVKAEEGRGPLSVRKGLKQFFDGGGAYGVICSKGYCCAVWKAADGKAFCYWDPHPTGPVGNTSPTGGAGLVLFATLEELADNYKSKVEALGRPGPNKFYISSVKVFWEFSQAAVKVGPQGAVSDEGYEWKVLTAYSEMARGRTILRGSRPCDLHRFIRDSQLQSSCSAIVGTCMTHVRRPHLWTKKTVDEIISIACQLFTASVGQLGYEFRPGDDILMPLQVVKRFVLGVNFVSYDLHAVASGKLESKDPTAMSIKAALTRFFEASSHGILWVPPHAYGIWRVQGQPQYYLFEPSASGPTGLRADAQDDGAACVMTFSSPKLMSHAVLNNYPSEAWPKQFYHIYSMAVMVRPIKKFGADPPLIKPAQASLGLVPATSKVGIDGRRRRADEGDRKHPPGSVTCLDATIATDARDREDATYKGIRNTSGWLVLGDGTQFLSAQHSMACKKFPYGSRGNQALACCVMAVAMSRVEDVCRWCQTTLDQILESGDQLYQDSYLHYKPKQTKILHITQILRKFYTPGNCVCRVIVYEPRQQGIIEDESLLTMITEFFREEKSGVFVVGRGEFAVALFRTPRGFYMFDPADRDRYGRAVAPPCTGKARACFSQYPSVELLVQKLIANIPPGTAEDDKVRFEGLDSSSFEIYGMSVSSLRRMNQHERDPTKHMTSSTFNCAN